MIISVLFYFHSINDDFVWFSNSIYLRRWKSAAALNASWLRPRYEQKFFHAEIPMGKWVGDHSIRLQNPLLMILWWFLLGPTKVLRFEGVLADDVEENENRKFVIAVSLGDDSVGAAWPGNHGSIFCSEMWPPKPWEFLTHVLHRSHFTAFCGRITRVPSQT